MFRYNKLQSCTLQKFKKKRNALKKRYDKTAKYIKNAKNCIKKYTAHVLIA